MNGFGLLMETANEGKSKEQADWSPFWWGCFAGAVPWAIIFANAGAVASRSVPAFVWAILFVYLAFFNSFPINMVLQYRRVGWWSDAAQGFEGGGYLFGERVYQILSLVAKSLLLWLVVGGANQPNEYTRGG